MPTNANYEEEKIGGEDEDAVDEELEMEKIK